MKPRKYFSHIAVCAALVGLTACDQRPTTTVVPVAEPAPAAPVLTRTFETSRVTLAIDKYVAAPVAESVADVDKAFADLKGEIAELDKIAATNAGNAKMEAETKAIELRNFEKQERLRYVEAQARVAAAVTKENAKELGREIKEDLKDGAKATGEALKDAGEAVKDKLDNLTN